MDAEKVISDVVDSTGGGVVDSIGALVVTVTEAEFEAVISTSLVVLSILSDDVTSESSFEGMDVVDSHLFEVEIFSQLPSSETYKPGRQTQSDEELLPIGDS